jgi:hypothetical protein
MKGLKTELRAEVTPFESFFSQLPALEEDDFSQVPPAHWEP